MGTIRYYPINVHLKMFGKPCWMCCLPVKVDDTSSICDDGTESYNCPASECIFPEFRGIRRREYAVDDTHHWNLMLEKYKQLKPTDIERMVEAGRRAMHKRKSQEEIEALVKEYLALEKEWREKKQAERERELLELNRKRFK